MSTQIHKNLVGADAVHPAAFVQATDPGSVGANLFWLDTSTSPPTLKVRNVSNTAWTIFSAGTTGATGASGTNGATGAAGPPGSNIVSGAAPYINIQDQKAQNTVGGAATAGSWQVRTLNTIVANDQFLATLASNQVTLPAGTYRCAISSPFNVGDACQTRLQNITDTTTALIGTSEFAANSGGFAQVRSVITGRFVLFGAKALSVQYQVGSVAGASTVELGRAANFGTEVYTIAEFWLEGPPPPFMGSTQFTVLPSSGATRPRQDQQQHSLNTPPQ